MLQQLKIWSVIVIASIIAFGAIYDTVYLLKKHAPSEITAKFDSERAEKEKEKEKEGETDELSELFFEEFFLSVSHPVSVLSSNALLVADQSYIKDYYADIVPPPPKA